MLRSRTGVGPVTIVKFAGSVRFAVGELTEYWVSEKGAGQGQIMSAVMIKVWFGIR